METSAHTPPYLFYVGGIRKTFTIFIHAAIMEDVVELVSWKLSGSSVPEGTYSEAL